MKAAILVVLIGVVGFAIAGLSGCASNGSAFTTANVDAVAEPVAPLVKARMRVTSRDCDISIVPIRGSAPDDTKQVMEFHYRGYGQAGVKEAIEIDGGQVVIEFSGHATDGARPIPHDLELEMFRTAAGKAGEARGTVRLTGRKTAISSPTYRLYLWGFDDRRKSAPDGRVRSTMLDPQGRPVILDRPTRAPWKDLEIAATVKPWHSQQATDQPWLKYFPESGTLSVYYLDEILELRLGS